MLNTQSKTQSPQNAQEWLEQGQQVVMNTYGRFPIVLSHGEGATVYDVDGKAYLDFVAGIAVNSLGYAHPALNSALAEQLGKMAHCSNLYWNTPNIELATTLTQASGFDKVFFCNSGAEAIEAAIKLARKYGVKNYGPHRVEIITMKDSFHGRTMGAISATGQPKYQKDLAPLLPGIHHAPLNDFEALSALVSDKTTAILMEVIQGEGGIRPADAEFLKKVRALCDEKDILLMFDEVQTGIGRTGELFAFQGYGVAPDIVTLAKGLGGGFPIGAMMAKERVALAFAPGDHASTFGGNPLACTAANTVLAHVMAPGFLEQVRQTSSTLVEALNGLKERFPTIRDVRGKGLILGMECSAPVQPVIQACIQKGLLLVGAGPTVIRFVPPLNITQADVENAVAILAEALAETPEPTA